MTVSIKRRLLFVFSGIIALLLIPSVSFIVIDYSVETQYKNTIETMILEYRITEASDQLISLYNSLLQDVDNKGILSKYEIKSKEIDDVFFQLNKIVAFKKSKSILNKLESTVGFIEEYCKRGFENTLKGDFNTNSEILEQISRGKANVKQDVSDFILAELEFTRAQQQKLQDAVKFSWLLGLTLFIVAAGGSVILALFWSGRISDPLVKLSKLAEDISKGNLQLKVEKELLQGKDEVGSLAVSFNNMVISLERNIGQLNESNAHLLEMTDELKMSGEILKYQKKSLENVNKELDDFTYIVSHDLKEPLRSIDAYSKFVMEDYQDKIDEDGKHYLERIRVNAERMKKLIEDLLELSRFERTGTTIEQVEAMELIDEVKMKLEYTIKERAVEIVIKDKLPAIFCDRVRLTEVFYNLVSNAIKFIDKPKPVIEIGYRDKGDFHEFSVKDNGIGIKEEYFDKIFEIFQRLGKREDAEGTGAGLTIVKKIIQLHKGEIWLESKPGEGSTFYFTIPKDKGALTGEKLPGKILPE